MELVDSLSRQDDCQSFPRCRGARRLTKSLRIWTHDPDWQQHEKQHINYPFSRFQEDWSPKSPANEYGVIRSHKIVAARLSGNVLLMGSALTASRVMRSHLNYDPKTTPWASRPVQLYLGP